MYSLKSQLGICDHFPLIPLVLQAVFGDQGVVSRNVGELVDVAKLVALLVAGATNMKTYTVYPLKMAIYSEFSH